MQIYFYCYLYDTLYYVLLSCCCIILYRCSHLYIPPSVLFCLLLTVTSLSLSAVFVLVPTCKQLIGNLHRHGLPQLQKLEPVYRRTRTVTRLVTQSVSSAVQQAPNNSRCQKDDQRSHQREWPWQFSALSWQLLSSLLVLPVSFYRSFQTKFI